MSPKIMAYLHTYLYPHCAYAVFVLHIMINDNQSRWYIRGPNSAHINTFD